MNNALHAITLIGNLSAAALYERSPEDVETMRAALLDRVEATFALFVHKERAGREHFTFKKE